MSAAAKGIRPDRLQKALEMPAAYPFQPKLRVYPDRPDAADAGDLLAHHDLAPLLNEWMASSDRISTQVVGRSTEGRDLYLVTITAPETKKQTRQQARWRHLIEAEPREGGAQQAAGRAATSSRSGSAPTSTATSGRAPTPRCR